MRTKTTYSFGCLSWPSTFLTIAIIGIRAFQTNAEPMSQWSAGSWMLMLLPMYLPFMLWLALLFLAAIASAFSSGTGIKFG
jgi:hypothetical protein